MREFVADTLLLAAAAAAVTADVLVELAERTRYQHVAVRRAPLRPPRNPGYVRDAEGNSRWVA